MEEYLNELSKVQRDAVINFEGASLIIAGAGSGKTRVLTYRIAHLLKQNIPPYSILSLTFTNKAAKEMKERIANVAGYDTAKKLWMGTFHSIFARILRTESEHLGYTPNFTIYDTQDAKNLIKKIIKDLNLDDEVYKPNEMLNRISSSKNNLITAQAYVSNSNFLQRDTMQKKPRFADIYKLYHIRCKKSDAMDFDDLLMNTNILFRDFPDVLKKYQSFFKYILVDEYQDTNFSQYVIINKLATNHKNICVVGDDSQSIYSFRGAKIENILNFRNDYPDYKIFKLEQNYRSTKTIVNAANSLIAKNKNQIQKKVWSDNETGNKIKVIKTLTDSEEGFVIANSIIDMRLTNQSQFSDFAILYRTNAQSRIFEESLRKRNIPYKLYGSLSFYQRKEIKDVLSYFRLVINHLDSEALKRIINYPARGIGKTTLDKLENYSNESGIPMWEIILDLEKHDVKLNSGTINKLKSFASLILEFRSRLESEDAYTLAFSMASQTGILNEFKQNTAPENVSKYENIQELLNGLKEFVDNSEPEESVTLNKYLENVALLTNADNEKEEDKNKVTLMTIHSAKGLEFDNIFIVGVEEELFPSRLSVSNPKELEEERRLFYVAITRAKTNVSISYAESRYKWGISNFCNPSRFIQEIDSDYLDAPEENSSKNGNTPFNKQGSSFDFKKKLTPKNTPPLETRPITPKKKNMVTLGKKIKTEDSGITVTSTSSGIQVGMTVGHERFGIGKVIHLEGTDPNIKATVFFQNAGQKQLLLKFAKLKIINN